MITTTPTLSPVLIAGLPLRLLPPIALQPLLDTLMGTLRRRHPEVFTRLGCIDNPVYEIDPIDLPFRFLLRMTATAPRLRAARDTDAGLDQAGATIRGPLLTLIELLEGRTDGDALFFSRRLTISGDTEAVVALRNALDDAEVDLLGDILASAGPLASPLSRALGVAGHIFKRAALDLETVRGAILEPVTARLDGHETAARELEARITELQHGGRRRRREAP